MSHTHLSAEVFEKLSKPTMPLIEAGRLLFGLGRWATYAAAEKGDIPSIKVGRKLVCPTGPLRRMIGLDGPEGRRPNGTHDLLGPPDSGRQKPRRAA